MIFSKNLIAATLTGLLTLSSLGCDHEMPSQWGESPVIVDGQANEWAEIALYHFEEHDFSFALQNDATNLYQCYQGNHINR